MITINKKKQACDFLLRGKVLVLPSETSYGISCVASNQEAVDKIFAIKKRNKNKSLLVVVSSIAMAKQYLEWNDLLEKLAKKYWPGALTVVAQAKMKLASGVVGKDGALALRVTNQPILKYLSAKLAAPLVSTSANISGKEGMYNIDEVVEVFGKRKIQPNAVFDYGKLPLCKASTIVSVAGGELRVVRQGEIKIAKKLA